MKTSHLSLSIFLLFAILNISATIAQQTHIVTLNVKTDDITSDNTLEVCYFTSVSPGMRSVRSEGNIEDFNLIVNAGDTIIWRGLSISDENDVVTVRAIDYHGGDNVFGQNSVTGINENSDLVAVVSADANGKKEKYTIKFTVMNNGRRRGGLFQIDPKITVKP